MFQTESSGHHGALYVVDDSLFDEHRALGYHPERPERLAAVRNAVTACRALGVEMQSLTARDASDEQITRAHAPAYLEALEKVRGLHVALDPDTYIAPSSVEAARRAAGSAVVLVDALLVNTTSSAGAVVANAKAGSDREGALIRPRSGIAVLRPPGHHAMRTKGMGFCLFNNIAVAACSALASGLSRVAIVDFDVHHGNGTQDIVWADPRALFISLHQYPFYPGTGDIDETGVKEGRGYTINIPLSHAANDAVYEAAFDEIVLPILDEYAPELILVSAGFDAHERDPLAAMKVTEAGYIKMTQGLVAVANKSAKGRLGLFLEGGYDLSALEASVTATLLAATGQVTEVAAEDMVKPTRRSAALSAQHRAELDRARQAARKHWTTL